MLVIRREIRQQLKRFCGHTRQRYSLTSVTHIISTLNILTFST